MISFFVPSYLKILNILSLTLRSDLKHFLFMYAQLEKKICILIAKLPYNRRYKQPFDGKSYLLSIYGKQKV